MKKMILVLILTPILLANYKLAAQNWVNGGNTLTATGKLGTKSNYSLSFITNNTERGRITNGGNWGIGTLSPGGAKLTVVGGTNNGILTSGVNGVIATATTGFGILGTSSYVGVGGNSSASNGKGVQGIGFYGVYAKSSKSGGDGVRSEVSGTSTYGVNSYSENSYGIYARTGNSSSYAGYFIGNLYSTGSYLGSDAKLKKNITSVDNAMNIISKLQPKNYEYQDYGNFAKMNLPKGKHYGFVAQDLEKILPNLVKQTQFNIAKSVPVEATSPIAPQLNADEINTNPEPLQPTKEETIDFKAVNYIELIPIIVKAMQEQQVTIEKQNAKIEALTQLVNQLKNSNPATSIKLSGVSLEQNTPNPPVGNSTRINYNIPSGLAKAELVFTNAAGQKVKQVQLNRNGPGLVDINTSSLSAGTYFYTIYVGGKSYDTKKMILNK